MEQLLHYVWKHKLFPLTPLHTTDGQPVEVIDPGLYNRNAGPDFFNAKVKVGDTVWVGNVEIHDRASDWFLHHHETDSHYDNVVLHVVGIDDTPVRTARGTTPQQMQLDVPQTISDNYEELLKSDAHPPCHAVAAQMSRMELHAWMNALQTERLEQKTQAIRHRVDLCGGSWEDAFFVTLARNYGFGINSDAFEQWALSVPLQSVAHHRDDLFQIEAIFMGQAGLLDIEAVPRRYREAAARDDYFGRMAEEYRYLAHKFGLKPIDRALWRFLRLRPQNFPHIRIAQLANLYYRRTADLSRLLEAKDAKEVENLLRTSVTPYWQTHYAFGAESAKSEKHLSASSLRLLLINTAVPMVFAYGAHRQRHELCDRAFDMLSQIKGEDNHIVRLWRECGIAAENAGDTQALIQLQKQYCDRRECLRCRIGHRYLTAKTTAQHG